jgi:hypothetical protein
MKSNISLIALLFFLFSINISAANYVAEVVKVRGKVTQLRPGALSASKVKLGDRLSEDTSIVTAKRSFIRVKFIDDSILNLGPKGKVVITQMRKKKAGIITLLKGKLRTSVKKVSKQKKNKFFIKTRTAALGVRGTEFQTIYNPDNKVTNLLTYKGKVAMVKVEKGISQTPQKVTKKKKVSKQIVERTAKNEINVEEAAKTYEGHEENLEALLESKEAVVVEQGQFSGVVKNLTRTTEPVQISPVQFNVLYANKDMVERKDSAVKKKVIKDLSDEKISLKQKKQKAPAEGFHNKKTGEFAAKSGGFIDLNTGLYVPPKKDAVFNKELGVYEVQKVGAIDKKTGQYVAPKGLKLDAKKGFVLKSKKKATKEEKQVLLAMTSDLNEVIKKDLFVGDEEEIKKKFEILSTTELFTKNTISLSLIGADYNVEQIFGSYEGSRYFYSDENTGFELNWDHSSAGSWQPVTSVYYRRVDLHNNSGFTQQSESLLSMSAGFRKAISSRWNLLTLASIDQMFFTDYSEENSVVERNLTKVALPKLSFIFEGDLIKTGRFTLDTRLGVMASLSKDAGDLTVKEGVGTHIEFGAKFWATSNLLTRLAVFNETEKHDTSTSVSSMEMEHETGGLKISVGYIF